MELVTSQKRGMGNGGHSTHLEVALFRVGGWTGDEGAHMTMLLFVCADELWCVFLYRAWGRTMVSNSTSWVKLLGAPAEQQKMPVTKPEKIKIRLKLAKRFMKYYMFKDYCKCYATLDRQFSSRIRQILTKVKRTWASLLLLSPGSQHHMISKPDPVRSVSLIFVHAETCLQNAWHFEPTLSFLIRDMSISCKPVEVWVWKFRKSSHLKDQIYPYNRCKRGLQTRQGVSKKCRFQSAAEFRSWQKYMGLVLFLCGSLLLEMQKKSAICISHFGDTYFFLLLMLTHLHHTALSYCLVCCNKFKVLNAWDSVFGTSNYIEMRVWAYTVLYFFTTKREKFKLRHRPYLFLKIASSILPHRED